MPICAACHHQFDTDADTANCPNCNELISHKSPSKQGLLTIVESPASAPRTTPNSSENGPQKILKNVDGYDIISLLGYGGMGSVYLAYDPLLDREVALKLLAHSADDSTRAKNSARFLSEAMLTGKLSHAGIIPIHRIGFDPSVGFYYTMRYVKGRTLAGIIELLAAKDPVVCNEFGLHRILTIFLRVCEAVGFAHQYGIIHRDIKPANIMVADFGEVLVLDWGLAKDIAETSDDTIEMDPSDPGSLRLWECRKKSEIANRIFLQNDLKPRSGNTPSVLNRPQSTRADSKRHLATGVGQILGTPSYLSPEQGAGETKVTATSDVYSLGVTLYELLTLCLPANANSTEELVAKTILGDIVPIKKRPEALLLPNALCEIVSRALSLQPERRYGNAKEMADELVLYLDGKAIWKPVVNETCLSQNLTEMWSAIEGSVPQPAGEFCLDIGTRLRCRKFASGDFRCECEFWVGQNTKKWAFSVGMSEVLPDGNIETRYDFRVGVEERPYIELLRNGVRVQRRFDIRLRPALKYRLTIQMEESHLTAWLDDRRCLEYKEFFPQTGGAIDIGALHGRINVSKFKLDSRGAPLNISFMALPDRFYRTGRHAEARELYRQFALSHPDRAEGLIALYKSGLCSTALQDIETAFTEFTCLEGTMLDHCCALGLAQIGMKEGNIDWAWEAIKNGYRSNRTTEVRNEMWFSLIGLIEKLDSQQSDEKLCRYREILDELNPEPHEAGQLAFEMLDLVHQSKGWVATREEAIRLLSQFENNPVVLSEALVFLGRAGISDVCLNTAINAMDRLIASRHTSLDVPRFQILRAETHIALGALDDAMQLLRSAILDAGPGSSNGLWAQGWQILILYLKGNFKQALTDVHEVLVRFRRLSTEQCYYFRLLEGLTYTYRKQSMNASRAFTACAQGENVWSKTAAHILECKDPTLLEIVLTGNSASQVAEALFLAGEAHRGSGNSKLALDHYAQCLDKRYDRAMIAQLVKNSLANLQSLNATSRENITCSGR